MKNKNLMRIINLVCAAVLLWLLVVQFIPFWSYGEPEKQVSIQGYIWVPTEHTGLDKALSQSLGAEVTVENVLEAVWLLLIGAVSIILLLCLSGRRGTAWLPLITGLMGIWQYAGNPVFRQGANWQLHLVLAAVAAVLAAINLILFFPKKHQ